MVVSRLARRLAGCAASGLVAVATLAGAPSSAAPPGLAAESTLSLPVTGEVELGGPTATLPLPAGSRLAGELNPDFTLAGDLLVPDTEVPVRLPALPRYGETTASVRLVATAPTETVFADDGSVTVVHRFRLAVPALDTAEVEGPVVREGCRTGEITATLHGDTFDLFTPFTLEGSFSVPAFRGCSSSVFGLPGYRDLLLTDLLAGDDNTLRLTVGPLA